MPLSRHENRGDEKWFPPGTCRSAARNRNQDRSAPADGPFRVESRVLMATHRVSARAHPRFDRHTPPKTWQTCSCQSSLSGVFTGRVPPSFYPLNPRGSLAGQTGVETAIATARPFLGVRASSLGLQKALGALYNFPAGSQVVGCKAGPQSSDEVGCPAKPG